MYVRKQVTKLATMKKSDLKKQRQMNDLKGELVKKERILGNKDKEIMRIQSKLKACEQHIAQLLKLQSKSRVNNTTAKGQGSATGLGSGTGMNASVSATGEDLRGSLSREEAEYLVSSKGLLDNLLADRLERRRLRALFDRKNNVLQGLNKVRMYR
jgi:hypothetical protein